MTETMTETIQLTRQEPLVEAWKEKLNENNIDFVETVPANRYQPITLKLNQGACVVTFYLQMLTVLAFEDRDRKQDYRVTESNKIPAAAWTRAISYAARFSEHANNKAIKDKEYQDSKDLLLRLIADYPALTDCKIQADSSYHDKGKVVFESRYSPGIKLDEAQARRFIPALLKAFEAIDDTSLVDINETQEIKAFVTPTQSKCIAVKQATGFAVTDPQAIVTCSMDRKGQTEILVDILDSDVKVTVSNNLRKKK